MIVIPLLLAVAVSITGGVSPGFHHPTKPKDTVAPNAKVILLRSAR